MGFVPNPNRNGLDYVQVFYDDFNDKNTPPLVTFSPAWAWDDQLTRMGAGYGDGIYKVEGVSGEHTAEVFANVPDGGYVTFEYGGKYGQYDYVELLANGRQIWKGNTSSGNQSTDVKVPLPPGAYTLKWVYHFVGGTTITIPPETETPDNPANEVCADSGNNSIPIDYSMAENRIVTPRSSIATWGGENFYTGQLGHGSDINGAILSRTFKAPSFGSMSFRESLHVAAGEDTQVDGLYPVRLFYYQYNQKNMYGGDDYFALNVNGVEPPGQSGWETQNFHTNGEIDITFQYLTFMVDRELLVGAKNASGRSTKYRAEFNVYLVPDGATNETADDYRILQVIENVGLKQRFTDISDWSKAEPFHVRTSVTPGRYRLLFSLLDAVSDNDKDIAGYYYYAAFRGVEVKAADSQTVTGYDNTQVKVELINRSTNTIEQSKTYGTNGAASADYNINFYGLKPDTPYQVRYTLIRGTGTKGGLYDTGGSLSLKGGVFMEQWAAYCTSNGDYYPESESSQRPPTSDTVIDAPVTPGVWGFLDRVNIQASRFVICADTFIRLTVLDGETLIEDVNYDRYSESQMQVSFTNTSNSVKTYLVRQEFHSTCGDGASLSGGQVELDDVQQPKPSHITVSGYSVTNNHAIMIGGCDGSTITVTLTNEQGDIVYQQQYSGNGLHSFAVSDLPYQPYSKYRLQIETDQKGVVNPISGKAYMTTFKLVDFRVYEDWENIPDTFNGKLEFFINGRLQGTYTGSGGFTTVSYFLPKGTNNLKWVFTELGTGNVYDQCEIDFLKITNWISDNVKVVPYCDPGGGDVCVEELIKCLLKLWNDRPKACVIGKTVWLFT
jgi:hypothetical protein